GRPRPLTRPFSPTTLGAAAKGGGEGPGAPGPGGAVRAEPAAEEAVAADACHGRQWNAVQCHESRLDGRGGQKTDNARDSRQPHRPAATAVPPVVLRRRCTLAIIYRNMRGALRTVLVLSERPHPWAFLLDRLDPELISVQWARPAEVGAHNCAVVPWAIAGTGTQPAPDLAHLAGTLFSCRWVGPAPEQLPVRPLIRPTWHAISSDLELALAIDLRGVRLAPGRGLRLPDGSVVSRVAELEA